MSHLQTIRAIEDAARKRDVNMAAFFKAAGIAHTTWGRWKTGSTSPTFKTWARVEKAVKDLGLQEQGKAN